MDKEKQIEEMARIVCDNYNNGGCEIDGYVCNYRCSHYVDCERLYNAGYRKESETAEKFAEMLKAKFSQRFEWLKEKESLALDKDKDIAFNCFYNRKQELGLAKTMIEEICKELTEGKN